MSDEDKYLKIRGGVYHYYRRVPGNMSPFDSRGTIRFSLKTKDVHEARAKRDSLVEADDRYWSSLVMDNDAKAEARYNAAVARAKALNIEYITSDKLLELSTQEIVDRVNLALPGKTIDQPRVEAVMGAAPKPKIKISEAFKIYFDELCQHEKHTMSAKQYKSWKKVKLRARNNCIKIIGDVAISDVTRGQAKEIYNFWNDRIINEGISPSTANRDLGNIRKLYKEYHEYIGDEDRTNPFRKLSFTNRVINKPPSFSVDWITSKLLAPHAFRNLNRQATLIFYCLIETGCRPSEICNIRGECIHLDGQFPYIELKEQTVSSELGARKLKTISSVRQIPLIGCSLEAFKLSPDGFSQYYDKEDNFSATMMGALRSNKLLESDKHIVYSIRHAFKTRCVNAGIDFELREYLMGHEIDLPDYGDIGSMEWKHSQLKKIELPFPKTLFDHL